MRRRGWVLVGCFLLVVLGVSIGVPLWLRGVGGASPSGSKSTISKARTVIVHAPPPPSTLICLQPSTPNVECFGVAARQGFLGVTQSCSSCTADASTTFALTSGLVVCQFAYCVPRAPSPPPSPPPCAQRGLRDNNVTGTGDTVNGCGNVVVGSDVTVVGSDNDVELAYKTSVVGDHNTLLYVTSDSIVGNRNVVQSSKNDRVKGSRNRVADTSSHGGNKVYGSSDTMYNDTSTQVFGVNNVTLVGEVSQVVYPAAGA